MKKFLFVLVMVVLTVPSVPALAQDGFYLGMDLGIAVAPGLDVNSTDNDVGTPCDGFINNDGSGGYLVTPEDCNPPPSAWSNAFDGGSGILAGAAMGYRMGSFRVEGEYFYRGTTYDDRDLAGGATVSDDVTQDKVLQELAFIEGGVDDVLSHNFFANLYYDYRSDSKFTPYVGFGVGFSRVSLDYFNKWTRSHDPEAISTFDDFTATDEEKNLLHRRLAGTTSIARAKLSDTLFGYQVLAGVDYQVSEPVSIGLKFRWADFGEFESNPREWDQLRSHDSARSPGGARVQYKVMSDDIQFWGVSLNMKYQF